MLSKEWNAPSFHDAAFASDAERAAAAKLPADRRQWMVENLLFEYPAFDDTLEFVKKFRPERLLTVPATELAVKHVGRPLPNAVLLGGFAAISSEIGLDAVTAAIRQKFPEKVARANVAAANEAYRFVLEQQKTAGSQRARAPAPPGGRQPSPHGTTG